MILARNLIGSKDKYNELAFSEVYSQILVQAMFGADKGQVEISNDDLRYNTQVMYKQSDESKYVWDKLESLGYKVESYYKYPNGNGDEGIKVSWG